MSVENYLKAVEAQRRERDELAQPAASKVLLAFGEPDPHRWGPWLLELARATALRTGT